MKGKAKLPNNYTCNWCQIGFVTRDEAAFHAIRQHEAMAPYGIRDLYGVSLDKARSMIAIWGPLPAKPPRFDFRDPTPPPDPNPVTKFDVIANDWVILAAAAAAVLCGVSIVAGACVARRWVR